MSRQFHIIYAKRTRENYRNIVRGMIVQAKNEIKLYHRDKNAIYLLQAGEKCYNITVQIVNLYRIEKGLPLTTDHKQVRQFYRKKHIRQDTLNKLSIYGNRLHSNFYNHNLNDKVALKYCNYIINVAKRYFKI